MKLKTFLYFSWPLQIPCWFFFSIYQLLLFFLNKYVSYCWYFSCVIRITNGFLNLFLCSQFVICILTFYIVFFYNKFVYISYAEKSNNFCNFCHYLKSCLKTLSVGLCKYSITFSLEYNLRYFYVFDIFIIFEFYYF